MSDTNKNSIISTVSIIAFLLALIFTAYFYWQNRQLEQSVLVRIQAKQEAAEKLEVFKSQRRIYDKIRAHEVFRSAEASRIEWSTVLQDILRYQNFNLRFDSFSSDDEKLITIRGWSRTIEGVSLFLEELKKDPQIQEAFISSISRSSSGDTFGHGFDISFFYNEVES